MKRLMVVAFASFAVFGSLDAQSTSVAVWNRWEASLASAKSYANPYADVTVTATYTGPSGQTFSAPGFWDGGSTWRIRAAFPATGTWSWRTTCSDTGDGGLHNRTGSVSVSSYTGSNALYQRGLPKVSADKRSLTYANGTPFLWMGDTAWIAPLRATQSDWQTYVNDRKAKRFTVIQLSPASAWGGAADRSGNAPFTGSGLSRWNPAYWQGFDAKVKYANDQGLLILLVGLMEPTYRYPSSAEAQRFARAISARLHGSFAILSPSFDSPYSALGDDVGNAANGATSRHLITQHVGTSLSAAQSYADKGYLDFFGVQSGHNGGNRETCARNAIEWNLAMYHRSAVKPTINLEAFYDANGTVPSLGGAYQGTAKDARQLGWLSWLSGSLGYTYGAYGIWNWEPDASKAYAWSKAMAYSSSTHMKHLADFMASIAWWRLAPASSAVQGQPSAYLSKRAFARSSTGDLGVAYSPDANAITLSMSTFSGTMQARWFNPQTGAAAAISGTFANTGTRSFTPPSSGDWVLHLWPAPSGGTFTVSVQSVSSGRAYAVSTAQSGALYYIDRSYTISSLSPALSGGRLVRTANDDKALTASSHLTLAISGAATVYVGYDKRGTTAPSWLAGWPVTSESLALTDAAASPMRVYAKSFGAGSVTLGGNLAGGAAGAKSHYVVIVKPSGSVASTSLLALAEDEWEHEGDADGDGLTDAFEIANHLDPSKADADGDGDPDETELDGRGRTWWEAQESGGAATDGEEGLNCGLLGAEFFAVLALLSLRKRREAKKCPTLSCRAC